ncbi:hypothetical protein IAT40_005878 [Kwoniella sp. CBS 6097]
MPGAIHPQSPLILTLTLDKSSHKFLTDLRSKYFPSSRNFLSAHVTLFHAIPVHRFGELEERLNHICREQQGWDVYIGEPVKMGNRGVMVNLRERPLNTTPRIHQQLLTMLKKGVKEDQDRLTNQDLQPLKRPHVTILNKATSEDQVDTCLGEVTKLFEDMKRAGQTVGQYQGRAVGFELWEYLGGPWKPVKAYAFKGEEVPDDHKV